VELEQRAKLTNLEQRCQEVANKIEHLCKQIVICEKNGYTRSKIIDILSPVQAIFKKSPLGWRMQNWPQGYSGDYKTIEYICDAINRAPENTVEYCCEEYALTCLAAQQYTNLVKYQALQVLETFRIASEKPRVLSIACGSCRDLWSIQIFLKEFSSEKNATYAISLNSSVESANVSSLGERGRDRSGAANSLNSTPPTSSPLVEASGWKYGEAECIKTRQPATLSQFEVICPSLYPSQN
jgi:hypothetical protein